MALVTSDLCASICSLPFNLSSSRALWRVSWQDFCVSYKEKTNIWDLKLTPNLLQKTSNWSIFKGNFTLNDAVSKVIFVPYYKSVVPAFSGMVVRAVKRSSDEDPKIYHSCPALESWNVNGLTLCEAMSSAYTIARQGLAHIPLLTFMLYCSFHLACDQASIHHRASKRKIIKCTRIIQYPTVIGRIFYRCRTTDRGNQTLPIN